MSASAHRLESDATADALRDDLAETRWALKLYRLMLRAALDELHEAQVTNALKQSQIAALQEEIRRYIRSATVDGGVSAPETTAADPCVRLRE